MEEYKVHVREHLYALFVEGYYISCIIGQDHGEEMFHRFLCGYYYRSFLTDTDRDIHLQWLSRYRVRVFKRSRNSFSSGSAFMGEVELRRIKWRV